MCCAERTTDPRLAIVLWLAARGGVELYENAKFTFATRTNPERFHALTQNLATLHVLSSTELNTERKLVLLPPSLWAWGPLRRDTPAAQMPLPAEEGLSETLARLSARFSPAIEEPPAPVQVTSAPMQMRSAPVQIPPVPRARLEDLEALRSKASKTSKEHQARDRAGRQGQCQGMAWTVPPFSSNADFRAWCAAMEHEHGGWLGTGRGGTWAESYGPQWWRRYQEHPDKFTRVWQDVLSQHRGGRIRHSLGGAAHDLWKRFE